MGQIEYPSGSLRWPWVLNGVVWAMCTNTGTGFAVQAADTLLFLFSGTADPDVHLARC